MTKVVANSQGKVYISNGKPILIQGGGGGSAVINSLNVTPTTSAQTITATGGVDGYSPINVSAVTSSIDSNITAENIKKNVTILGVTGSYEPSYDPTAKYNFVEYGNVASELGNPYSVTSFSNTSYLLAENVELPTDGYEFVVRYSPNGTVGGTRRIMIGVDTGSYYPWFGVDNAKTIKINTGRTEYSGSISVSAHTTSWLLFKQTPSGFEVYSLMDNNKTYNLTTLPDLNTWEQQMTKSDTGVLGAQNTIYIGRNANSSYASQCMGSGFIDLDCYCFRNSITKQVYWSALKD